MANSNTFDAVIVGSGFGGSVMAYRLAKANLNVCLLERGRKYPPDSFPRSPYRSSRNFWDPSEGFYGLFDIWSFRNTGALVSSGLGGGSLIYANVLIRKDSQWFDSSWPVSRKDLDPHYDRVEKMLNAQPYPFADRTPKTLAMKYAAESMKGVTWGLPNLAVSFHRDAFDPMNPNDPANPPLIGEPISEDPARKNLHNRTRTTCRLCGECDFGCNYGSKNTLDFNYLSEALHLGADIKDLCEVRSFRPRRKEEGGGFSVSFVEHDLNREGIRFKTSTLPPKEIFCKQLILSAGTLGTTYLLLKNRDSFPNISGALGNSFSVNGDLLSFIFKSREKVNGTDTPRILDANFGPVITSYIRAGDELDGSGLTGRGFYIEDGGNPSLLSWVMEYSFDTAGFFSRIGHFGQRIVAGILGLNRDADLSAEVARLLGPCDVSKSSMPILSMGRDNPGGKFSLDGKDKHLQTDWKIDASKDYYKRLEEFGRKIAAALNADYERSLAYRFLRQVMTAHPLGGCPMGANKDVGVVDSYGQVFDCPGLYIADGSVLPGPVGPNPSLTIAALADRFADKLIDDFKRI